MTTWAYNTNKTASSWSDASKTASTWDIESYIVGAGYPYNQLGIAYNDFTYAGKTIYYNSLALPTSWALANKS